MQMFVGYIQTVAVRAQPSSAGMNEQKMRDIELQE